MEARSERIDGVLIFVVSGRLDAFGAQQLGEEARKSIHDDDRDLVIDMTDSPYLSSGGIRVFIALKREMKRRNGRFALAGVGDYPTKVLAMAGFTAVFEIFMTVRDAVNAIARKRKDPSLPDEIAQKKIEDGGVTLAVEPGWISARPVLRVLGSLDILLHARLTEEDIRTKGFQEIKYSLGLGALGTSLRDAMPLLGEMITLHGSMVWLPTDGNSTPDFLTPESTGDVPVYTGYNITLDGPFNEYFVLDTGDQQGVPLSGIYQAIFAGAQKRVENYHGVVAVAIWGIIAGFASSGLKKAPIASFAPPGGASIVDPSQIQDWFASDAGAVYHGDTLVCFGIGVDLGSNLSYFAPDDLSALYYANPLNQRAAQGMYLHNHGVVFRNIPYDASLDLNNQVKKIVAEGEFVDMRHLLDSTRLRKAKIGVAYIQAIIREP
ncbi:MAG: STAS domain-containing protein [Methanomicrobiales archaeon]|nr:STAS domain-containing protein [Methanomicrobiales archaeon]